MDSQNALLLKTNLDYNSIQYVIVEWQFSDRWIIIDDVYGLARFKIIKDCWYDIFTWFLNNHTILERCIMIIHGQTGFLKCSIAQVK